MNGYDVDGVLVPRNVEPVAPYVVITGRTSRGWDTNLDALAREASVYTFPHRDHQNDVIAAGMWKASMVNLLGVTTFYEDDPVQAEIIRLECPGCDVVLVKPF